jgi:hypothetical protein
MDVFNAGAGKDTIVINASNIVALAQTGVGNRARSIGVIFTEDDIGFSCSCFGHPSPVQVMSTAMAWMI